jgi:hypothetical protein
MKTNQQMTRGPSERRIKYSMISGSHGGECKPGSSVGVVSDYGPDGRGSIPDRDRGFSL